MDSAELRSLQQSSRAPLPRVPHQDPRHSTALVLATFHPNACPCFTLPTVATGFSGYLSSLIKTLDNSGPHRLAGWDGSTLLYSPGAHGTTLTIDLVAAAAVVVITLLLILGVQQASGAAGLD